MMASFFTGIQQDFKIFLLAPLLCAVFRAVFLWRYWPFRGWDGKGKAVRQCFRFGFWWGMDINSYVYLVLMVLVSLPGAFLTGYFAVGDTVRLMFVTVFSLVLYTAFWGNMIFYDHFHDIFNQNVWLGRKAEKHNLADIFFNQHHGLWILLSYAPFALAVAGIGTLLLWIPTLPLPQLTSTPLQYALNTVVFLGAVMLYYFIRYGGSFSHRDKPEWDTVPPLVKKDMFLARATVDDLIALKNLYQHPLTGVLSQDDATGEKAIRTVLPKGAPLTWPKESPLSNFRRTAQGARIRKPKQIFFIVAESYAQYPLDDIYSFLHLAEGGRKFREDPHTFSLEHFLPAGMVSRPSLVGLMSGIFDANLQLNEREMFWRHSVRTSLPLQLKKLGYRSIYWYGGSATNGSFHEFAPAMGFDTVNSATEFCPADAPRTWVGVYDDVFLEHTAKLIKQMNDDQPTLHFVYTTSYHGPFKIHLEDYGYNPDTVMPEASKKLRRDHGKQQNMGTFWYADQALYRFVNDMKATYPDSLILVTGDHSAGIIPIGDCLPRKDMTLREQYMTSFAMYHRDLTSEMFAGNTIGSHMNLMPTLLELIAPQGFEYFSLVPPLTEPIDHVVTPYHWLTRDAIGRAGTTSYQNLTISKDPVPTFELKEPRFEDEINGWCSLTGWIVRHPELMR